MNNYEMSLQKELDFLIKYSLTADEWFLIKLIFYAQDGHPEYLTKFFSENKLGYEIIDLLKSIQDKGLINKSYIIPQKRTVFNPRDVDFNKQILKDILRHSEDLGMDLFYNYPISTIINGKTFSLRNVAKYYKSLDEMCWEYGKIIKFDPETHKHVMELLEYGKENNLIHSGICDFIISQRWLDLEVLKEGGDVLFDTMETL